MRSPNRLQDAGSGRVSQAVGGIAEATSQLRCACLAMAIRQLSDHSACGAAYRFDGSAGLALADSVPGHQAAVWCIRQHCAQDPDSEAFQEFLSLFDTVAPRVPGAHDEK